MDNFNENIWKVALELGSNERHFNQLQHQYRALASTWILAMFAGVQYVLSNWGGLPLPSEVILAVIGLAGAVGITQLWNLDIRVYHQLLEACFVEGLKLEAEYPWLPQVRTGMLAGQEARKQGVLARVVWFYLVGNGVALLVAASGTVLAVYSRSGLGVIGAGVTACAAALAIFLWNREIHRETRSPLLEAWSCQSA
ncbi:MAG TPA: hypothetical protein VF268_00885 [Gammaproteobacteria bacterium]|jgi:hypothetical protein